MDIVLRVWPLKEFGVGVFSGQKVVETPAAQLPQKLVLRLANTAGWEVFLRLFGCRKPDVLLEWLRS